jgi:hypothetical protein
MAYDKRRKYEKYYFQRRTGLGYGFQGEIQTPANM